MRPLLVALVVASLPAGAHGEPRSEPPHRELCRRDAVHHGAAIDLDVKGADIHEVFRLIADIAHLNIVVPDDVTGAVTLRLKRAPWDAVVCAIAGVHHLTIAVYDNILVVTRAAAFHSADSSLR
jgi:type II secretory pathway component GspD/PulD (secretin)